ncbi:MAG: hypothetical protein L0Z62_10895 [Gemmataceae bacterium]|nr:hypothetical protein [Gemmataceae bacterium]
MTKKKRYTVHVNMTARYWGHVEVEADTQAAAEELAGDQFECDWNLAEQEIVFTTVLTEDDCPVVYSREARALDPANPYRKVTPQQPSQAIKSKDQETR